LGRNPFGVVWLPKVVGKATGCETKMSKLQPPTALVGFAPELEVSLLITPGSTHFR
jgi:hypothetical protein